MGIKLEVSGYVEFLIFIREVVVGCLGRVFFILMGDGT